MSVVKIYIIRPNIYIYIYIYNHDKLLLSLKSAACAAYVESLVSCRNTLTFQGGPFVRETKLPLSERRSSLVGETKALLSERRSSLVGETKSFCHRYEGPCQRDEGPCHRYEGPCQRDKGPLLETLESFYEYFGSDPSTFSTCITVTVDVIRMTNLTREL